MMRESQRESQLESLIEEDEEDEEDDEEEVVPVAVPVAPEPDDEWMRRPSVATTVETTVEVPVAPEEEEDESDEESDDESEAPLEVPEGATEIGSEDPEVWLLASLVSDRAKKKRQCKVAETVLFRNGLPVCWLFHDRRGRLLRRHRKRLHWPTIRYAFLRKGLRLHKHANECDPPVAVLRWRESSETIATLLTWRQLKCLDTRRPRNGPRCWSQFVALQPLFRSSASDAISTGVYVHRYSEAELPPMFGNDACAVLNGQTRELLAWPPRAHTGSRLQSGALHQMAAGLANLVAARSRSGLFGNDRALRPLHLRSFVAEFIANHNGTLVLTFVHNVDFAQPHPQTDLLDDDPLTARHSVASRILSLARDIDVASEHDPGEDQSPTVAPPPSSLFSSSLSTTFSPPGLSTMSAFREQQTASDDDDGTKTNDVRPVSVVSSRPRPHRPWWQRPNRDQPGTHSRALRMRLASLAGIVGRA